MTSPADVLLVEDNAGDVLLVEEALAAFEEVRLHVAFDGEQALQMLADPEFACPRFVLMDVNTPRKGALEVLAEMRRRPEWAVVPVVVYSTSGQSGDARLAYQAGANAYLPKPVSLDAFLELIQITTRFWLCTVPPAPPKG